MHLVDAAAASLTADPRFAGSVSAANLTSSDDPFLHTYLVHFAAGARTAWHSHARGQLLVCIAGVGYAATRDGERINLTPGTAVWIAPSEDHWHGATETSPMTHLAVQTADRQGDGSAWAELVDDATYRGAQ